MTYTQCNHCHGKGVVQGARPSHRSRFIRYDDLTPDDYTTACLRCDGTGRID